MRLGGCQGCAAPSAARPGLDAGALRHYIAKPLKEGAKKTEGQVQAEQPRPPWQGDSRVGGEAQGGPKGPQQERRQGGEATIPSGAKRSAKPKRGGGCDQEVSKRTLATSRKVCEEVSKKETRNHSEPCDVQVSLPRRADE
jgi:hypothetical protein